MALSGHRFRVHVFRSDPDSVRVLLSLGGHDDWSGSDSLFSVVRRWSSPPVLKPLSTGNTPYDRLFRLSTPPSCLRLFMGDRGVGVGVRFPEPSEDLPKLRTSCHFHYFRCYFGFRLRIGLTGGVWVWLSSGGIKGGNPEFKRLVTK